MEKPVFNLEFHLIEGNHDKISKKLESKLCLNFRDEILEIDDFKFVHDFDKNNEISDYGHIHPGFVINSSVKNIKLPCFVVTENQLLLPAFSEFTGLIQKISLKKEDSMFLRMQRSMRFSFSF
jgi:metallophosphoesterase superfamily enzyme